MDTIFYRELKKKYDEIEAVTVDTEKEDAVIKAYDTIMHFQNVARREGLLALEEESEALDKNDITQAYFHLLIMLIVDGTESERISEIGMNRYLAFHLKAYDGFICLMYYQAGRMIQSGDNSQIVDIYLKSMLPQNILKRLELREYENAIKKAFEEEQDKINKLCEDGKEINTKDHSVVNETAVTLLALSDRDIQRLLRDVDNYVIVIAMKVLPGKARTRLFDNMSQRIGRMIAEDMAYIGPVRLVDAEEACVEIMKRFITLVEHGEVCDFDTSILKVVIDIYENSQKENERLKGKYKELKDIIEEIYRN